MSRGLLVIVSLMLLGLLIWFCVDLHAPRIERDLSERATGVLVDGGFAGVAVTADGRDLTLTGIVASSGARDNAEGLVRVMQDVRAIDNRLSVLAVVEPSKPGALPVDTSVPSQPVPAEPEAGVPAPDDSISSTQPPVAAARSCQAQFNALLADEAVQFESNAARIKPLSHLLLDALAEVAASCPASRIEIAGHTDASGGADQNKTLSEARAAAVLAYLSEQGVDAKRLNARGYGEDQPIAGNDTAAGRAQNRRVEFIVEGVDL